MDKNTDNKSSKVKWLLMAALFVVLFCWFKVNHLPFFPGLFLTDSREKAIEEYSEHLLSRIDGRATIAIGLFPPYQKLELDDHALVQKTYEFLEENQFYVATVFGEHNQVNYRHHLYARNYVSYLYTRLDDEETEGGVAGKNYRITARGTFNDLVRKD